MQILYLIYENLKKLANTLLKGLTATFTNLPTKTKGSFSLVVLFALGIFYPLPLEAVKKVEDVLLSGPDIYQASFDYSLKDFSSPRAHVVPARFYFTATDSAHAYTPVAGTTAFPAWETNYATSVWGAPTSITPTPFEYNLFMQTIQIASDSETGLATNSLAMARARFSGEIVLQTFAGTSNFLSSPNSTKLITPTSSTKSFAMMQSKKRLYFFWLGGGQIKMKTSIDDFAAATTLSTPVLTDGIGLAGCTIKTADNEEYIALTHAKSFKEINILTFTDSSNDPVGSQSIILTADLIDTTKVAISQNPRTKKVTLTWTVDGTGYYSIYDFIAPATFNETTGPTTIANGFNKDYGISAEGYTNFESTLVLPAAELKSYSLRHPSTVAPHDSFGTTGYAVQLPFRENNRYYAGLVNYAFGDYYFYQRELKFPAQGRWSKDTKTLHLEGPPKLGSEVKIEYEFTEVATGSCLASLVNTSGGRTALNNRTGVIVANSNLFTIQFDTNMLPASYASYLDNSPTSKIHLLGSNSVPIGLIYSAGESTATGISFRPATNLQFSNNYSITIASDVIDWRGNQVWEPVTLNFTTQNTSSFVLASEVRDITAYADNSYSEAKKIASGGEASDTATVYLRVEAVDPAFNTIDTATISVLLNGAQIAQTSLTQTAAASNFFYGSFALTGPLATDSIYTFKSHPDSATTTSVIVDYPVFSPGYPASGATGIPVKPTITINASEVLLGSSVSSATVKLLLAGTQLSAPPVYVAGSKVISMTPAADLESEKTYTVLVSGVQDIYYNSQIGAFSYQFKIADVIAPAVTTYSPGTDESGVTIDRHIVVNFTEPLLASTVNQTNVKLTRAGIAASYSVILSGNQIRIDPDDAPDGGLRPQTTYVYEISTAVTDPSGNALSANFSRSFSTQPYHTPPTAVDSITLYKDDLLTTGWGLFEQIPASATVYIKVVGTDGATQTQDLATATLNFSWGAAAKKITLTETASDSAMISGTDAFYTGSFNFGTLPLYGFPTPLPPTSIGSLTFSVDLAPAEAATLTLTFPSLVAADTLVNTISGQTPAANATNVRTDTAVTLAFSDQLIDAGSLTSLTVSSGAVSIAGSRTLSADRRKIVFQPDSALPFSSTIAVNAIYAANGLKSLEGNPLYRAVNFTFNTQAAQTQPTSITQLNLFPDASYEPSTAYDNNDDFLQTGSIYIEVRAADAAPNSIDFTAVNISTGDSLNLNETNASSGVYRGVYNYSNLADNFSFKVTSAVDPSVSQTLLLTIPELTPQIPASGSSGVSVNTSIEVRADEALDLTTVNPANVKLFKGGVEVAGTVSYRSSEKEVVFLPASALATSTLYVYRMGGLKDLAGNSIASSLVVSFTTQASSVPLLPPIDYLRIYRDNAYTDLHSDMDSVAPGSQVFAEIKATDQSAITIDSTLIEQSSNLSAVPAQTTLIETGLNTGIFRGSLTIFDEEGDQVRITSLTDTTASVTLQTYFKPRVDNITPTPGIDKIVYLNQEFTIVTSKNVNPLTLGTSTVRLTDGHGLASYSISMADARTIKINSELQPDSLIALRITDDIKDTDGLAFPETTVQYTSIKPDFSFFRAYSDATFLQTLDNNAEVESGQTIYLRLDGIDAWLGKTEYATATLRSSLPDSEISLAETSAGRFTASFVTPGLPYETIEIIPESRNDLARTLSILPAFSLLSFTPASAAIAVPADSWPSWNFTRPVRSSDVTTTNFALKKVSDGTTVPGTLGVSTTGKQVRFQPAGMLPLLTQFEMSVTASIQDNSGNVLGEALKTRFTTQPPPAPPSDNIVVSNYESADYATKTLAVAFNGSLFLELVAKDTSFSTYETARVRVDSSDGSLDGLELTLVEISQPSGIFRLEVPINLAPGVSITVQSQADAALKIIVIASNRTTLQSIDPASGTTNLYLDHQIRLNFSHNIDPLTAATGISLLASDSRPIDLNFAYADSNRSVLITPTTSYASATRHQLQISTNLRDSNGLFLLPETAWLTTRGESEATFDLLTGIGDRFGQSVTLVGEAAPGSLTLLATTTNMFENYSETRSIRIQTASTTNLVTLDELTPGSFKGNFDLPADSAGNITATLLFAQQPALTFPLAPLPELVSINPASGSSDIAELPVISATFSRKLAFASTADALRIITDQGNIVTQASNAVADSTSFSWRPLSPLPLQSTCTLQLEGLTDYLGQSFALYRHDFSTGGRQGISIFSDNAFAQLIATDQVEVPVVFVEVAASGTTGLAGQVFDLYARSGTRASTTIKLQLQAFNPESGRFRCSLELEAGKAVPQYPLGLLPGEWLELTSPQLTDDRRVLYYQHSGSAAPVNILGIKLFSEKHFAQQVTDYIANPSLFIEVTAEDLNWFTSDTTQVKVYSDDDQTGMVLDLVENGTHSSQFRNFIRLSRDNTDPITHNLKTLPAQRIYIESVTDPAVRTTITYLPENTLKMMAVYPSPARGSSVNFRFYLNFPTYVDVKIYDTAGHEVFSTGIRGQEGENIYEWRFPRKTANGTYFYAIRIDNESGFPDARRRVRGKFAILR